MDRGNIPDSSARHVLTSRTRTVIRIIDSEHTHLSGFGLRSRGVLLPQHSHRVPVALGHLSLSLCVCVCVCVNQIRRHWAEIHWTPTATPAVPAVNQRELIRISVGNIAVFIINVVFLIHLYTMCVLISGQHWWVFPP